MYSSHLTSTSSNTKLYVYYTTTLPLSTVVCVYTVTVLSWPSSLAQRHLSLILVVRTPIVFTTQSSCSTAEHVEEGCVKVIPLGLK